MTPLVAHIDPPPRRGVSALVVIAALLVAGALTSMAWASGGRVRITVDGTPRTVAPGTTVADLTLARYTTGRPGSLYSANGGLLGLTRGEAATFYRNGRLVDDTQQVFDGDTIASRPGADVTEQLVTVKESIDPTATIQGSGPFITMVRRGTPGVALVRKGAISGEIVSHKVLVGAQNIVLQASMPTSADKIVALTFDDGPWPGSTLKIVDILKREGVPGTFFEIGEQARRWPSLSVAIVKAGNVVGNHTWSHPLLTKLKPAAIRRQIAESAKAIEKATGVAPVAFRPPYGAVNRSVWAQAKAAHEAVTLWDVDSLDWTRPGPARIVRNVTRHVDRVSVVLMHDGGGDRSQTVAALPRVIEWLKAHDYTFVTIPQLQAVR